MTTEHIYIGDEFSGPSQHPTNVTRRQRIRNRISGTLTELTFYEEGFLKIREENRKKRTKEHMLELRFLSPEPITSRNIATAFLWTSLGLGLLALIVSFALPMIGLQHYTIPATAITITLSILSLFVFIHRSEGTHEFRTACGQTKVLCLKGSLGCNRRMRKMARHIRRAIERFTAETNYHDVRYLRAEMKAHYRLAETGVITREACTNGTYLLLSKFG